jgi:hypothetical protein
MRRIFNKQALVYLVLIMPVAMLISVMFISLRDFKPLNQADVHQEKIAIPNKGAPEEYGLITSHEVKPVAKRHAEIQVDTHKIRFHLRKYDEVFEKAVDLEENAENIIHTGE